MVDESSDMLESGPMCPEIAPQTRAFAGKKHVKNTKI